MRLKKTKIDFEAPRKRAALKMPLQKQGMT